MTKFQVAYVPVGVPTFHLESAQKEFEKSIDLLNTITDAAIVPDKMLLSIQDLTNFLDTIEPSLIILQNITCLLYTSPSPRDSWASRMPSSA